MAPHSRAGVTQVLVFGSICQGAVVVPFFEPQPVKILGTPLRGLILNCSNEVALGPPRGP